MTLWTYPSVVTQYAEQGFDHAHIPWDEENNFDSLKRLDGRMTSSIGFLEHIARSPKHDLKNKTWFLQATGFNFKNLPNIVTGIEVRLTANRNGRATDDAVQLCLNDLPIGDNKATILIDNEKLYGGTNDLWNVENITLASVTDPSFGVIIRFQAHPHWPHKNPVFIDAIEMRIS